MTRSLGLAVSLAGALCAMLLLVPPPRAALAAQGPPSGEIDPSEPCVTSDCHSTFEDYTELHWDDFDGVGQCQKCHEPERDEHVFTPDDSAQACLGCHESLAEDIERAANIHSPVEDGCLDCHDPHGGEVDTLLVGVEDEDLKVLCFECHDEDMLDAEYTHGPADQGACNMCHDPHASPYASLLLAEQLELCGDCHEEIAEEIETAESVHDPVEDGCTECHSPHAAAYPKLLPANKRKVCDECHDDVVEIAENATVDHAPTTTKDECLNCHSPHAANVSPNLKKAQPALCLDCHDKRVRSGGTILIDMKGWLAENEEWHKPIRENLCSGCHLPHGGENFRMLVEPFPRRFYSKFSLDAYGLCFSCHEEGIATARWTRTLTRFRDGNRNLHFLHVNKAKRGRTCRACHDLHASSRRPLIREEVRYGRWMMPINFEKQENGGSCQPGCHKTKRYDRNARDHAKQR